MMACTMVNNNKKQRKVMGMWFTSLLLVGLLYLVTISGSISIANAQADPGKGEPQQPLRPAALSSRLYADLTAAKEPVSFLVVMRAQVDAAAVVAAASHQTSDNGSLERSTKAAALYHALTAQAAQSQAPLRAWLDQQEIVYRPFYLVNMIEVKGDLALAQAIQQRSDVDRLVANPLIANALTVAQGSALPAWAAAWQTVTTADTQATQALPYGLGATHATAVWGLGYTGQGIIVASQDTGVEWDNTALRAAYRGVTSIPYRIYLPLLMKTDMSAVSTTTISTNAIPLTTSSIATETVTHVYNWFDAWDLQGRPARCIQDAQVPCDDHGHGTHTVGTMVGDATGEGDSILGMAPDAKWIGCRNMENGDGTPASYTACFEFFLAPYPQGGDAFTDGRPELAPHIINNSWGCPPSEGCDAASLRQVVETMRAAGQMVVASAGNDGFICSSIRNPISMHDATFSVGAYNEAGLIASFSSRGPVTADGSGRLKPDISAPGVGVRSAHLGGGTNFLSGTSMASPHVAGAVALLWSAVPSLIGNIDLTEQVLIKSATPVPANDCPEGGSAVVPNNTYGYGQLNILAAVQLAQQPVELALQVRGDQATPIVDQAVTVTDQATGFVYEGTTGFNGIARISPIYPGNYLVTAVGTLATQTITLDTMAQQHVQLTITTDVD